MLEFDAWLFGDMLERLTTFRWVAIGKCSDGLGESKVDQNFEAELEQVVGACVQQTLLLGLKASHDRAKSAQRALRKVYGYLSWQMVKDEFRIFWEVLGPELAERRFAAIEAKKCELLNEILGSPPNVYLARKQGPSSVWLNIWKRFDAAKRDCEEAVYCYALERNTACVFHAMRVAELGLRALARRMKVKAPGGRRLEWAEWQQVLTNMSKVTDDIAQKMKRGPAKDDLLEFYRGAIGQFYGFKDEFRNQVMHVRKQYDDRDAFRSLTQVRDFMDKLAHRIDQNGSRVVGQ